MLEGIAVLFVFAAILVYYTLLEVDDNCGVCTFYASIVVFTGSREGCTIVS